MTELRALASAPVPARMVSTMPGLVLKLGGMCTEQDQVSSTPPEESAGKNKNILQEMANVEIKGKAEVLVRAFTLWASNNFLPYHLVITTMGLFAAQA